MGPGFFRLSSKKSIIHRVRCSEDGLLAYSKSLEVRKRRFSRHDKSAASAHKISLQPFPPGASGSLISLVALRPQDKPHIVSAGPPKRFPGGGIIVATTKNGLRSRRI